jgi:hypothetical protein
MKWMWCFHLDGSAAFSALMVRRGRSAMIRQAISCDICGAEKKQTNHWFVAYTHAGELRVSGWGAQGKIRAGSKHLCGQTCVHKLVDEFIAGAATGKVHASTAESVAEDPVVVADTSLTGSAAYLKPTSSPGLPASAMPAAAIAIAPTRALQEPHPPVTVPMVEDAPNYSSHRWRAEAWERERERERHSSLGVRRKSL